MEFVKAVVIIGIIFYSLKLVLPQTIISFRKWLVFKISSEAELMRWIIQNQEECMHCQKHVPFQSENNTPKDYLHELEGKYSIGVCCPFCHYWLTGINTIIKGGLIPYYQLGRKDLFDLGLDILIKHIERGKDIDWFGKLAYTTTVQERENQ